MSKKVNDNISEEEILTKRRMSKQTVLTVCMIAVSIFVISIATYAWFMVSNTPKIVTAEFKADTVGNLQISNIKGTAVAGTENQVTPTLDSDGKLQPELYQNTINLKANLLYDDANSYLSPCSTKEGTAFYKPVYLEGAVDSLSLIYDKNEADADAKAEQEKELLTKYVFEKKFFLRAGEAEAKGSDSAKYYDIFFLGQSTEEQNDSTVTTDGYGCYLIDDTTNDADGKAAYAIRVSFEIENSVDENGDATTSPVVCVYEPNYEKHNSSNTSTNYVEYTGTETGFGAYPRYRQYSNKSFLLTEIQTGDTQALATLNGAADKSAKMCTIKEGEDVFVTMRIWIEGMDGDCDNEAAADNIAGQIQFISEENLSYIE